MALYSSIHWVSVWPIFDPALLFSHRGLAPYMPVMEGEGTSGVADCLSTVRLL